MCKGYTQVFNLSFLKESGSGNVFPRIGFCGLKKQFHLRSFKFCFREIPFTDQGYWILNHAAALGLIYIAVVYTPKISVYQVNFLTIRLRKNHFICYSLFIEMIGGEVYGYK